MRKTNDNVMKPLWVKCACGKWNAVSTGNVVKYLDKILANAAGRGEKPAPRVESEQGDE